MLFAGEQWTLNQCKHDAQHREQKAKNKHSYTWLSTSYSRNIEEQKKWSDNLHDVFIN